MQGRSGWGIGSRKRAIGFVLAGTVVLALALLTVVLQRSPEPAAAQAAQPCNTYDGAGASYFEVPAGVTQIEASVYGAEGGFVLPPNVQYGLPGQGGGVVGALIPVTPGEVLEIRVGGAGVNSNGNQTPAPPGGFNGGGAGAVGSAHTSSTGGGASAILRGSQTLAIAGAGGGAAHGGGGGDGGLVGTDGTKNAGSTAGSAPGLAGGNGGTGGAGNPASQAGGNGSAGQGGRGGGDTTTLPVDGGGGGGGGYVGGGGGGGGPGNGGSGGGGGSSFDATGTATFETGVETGDGRVTLSYNCAAQPQPQSCVSFETPGTHAFQVPPWVQEIDAAVYGAQGGDVPHATPTINGIGGLGGGATSLPIPVTPGETLDVLVGARGANGGAAAPPAPAGGSPGGGDGGAETSVSGAGGGGASVIRRGAQTLVIAGGGGGGARNGDGGAGGFIGTDGTRKSVIGAFGGRAGGNGGAGGIGGTTGTGQDGSPGQGGAGGGDLSTPGTTAGGGGGGGGAVGGGGGGASGAVPGGGGGGSSAHSLGQVPVTWHTGVETGDGHVVLSYDCAGTDLSIEKQASAGTVTAGGQVMYTLIVRNNGPADDTGVTVTDSIPAGLDVVSAQPGQGSCQIAATVTCSLGDLPANGSTQILVTANVGAGVTGPVTNTAEVDGDRDETDPTNNRDERTITVDPPPPPPPPAVDLKVKKSVSASQANPGDQLTYTLVVTNAGPGDATKVKLVDTPPAEIRYVSARTGQGKCDIDAGVLRCSLGDLPADGQTQVQVTADVQQGATGALRNVVTVTAAEEDKNPDNNLDRQEITVPRPGGPQPRLDLQITKKASKVGVSGRVTYTLVVRNNGPDTAHDAVVVDTASRHVKVLSATTSKGKCKLGPPIRCTLGTIGKGKRVEIKVVAKLTEPGKLTNAASVASSDEDEKPKSNLAKAKSRLEARLQLVKRALATGVPKGGKVAFLIEVRNRSSVAIRNVRICDPLPDGLRFTSSAPRAAREGKRACWRISKLGAGKSRSFEIVTTMVASVGRVTNRASATAPGVRVARGSAGVNAGGAAGECVGVARRAVRRC